MRLMAPRPMPNRRVPVLAGGAVVCIALLVFLAAGWEIRGWALGAVLWVAAQALGFLLGKVGIGQPNVHGSGVVAFGMMATRHPPHGRAHRRGGIESVARARGGCRLRACLHG